VLGRRATGARGSRQAIRGRERTFRSSSRHVPPLRTAPAPLANTLRELGDPIAARELQQRILEVRLRTLPEEHSHTLTAREHLAVTLMEIGETATPSAAHPPTARDR
jgi:DNA-directed RNA polymerase specialized sigma24 family protein